MLGCIALEVAHRDLGIDGALARSKVVSVLQPFDKDMLQVGVVDQETELRELEYGAAHNGVDLETPIAVVSAEVAHGEGLGGIVARRHFAVAHRHERGPRAPVVTALDDPTLRVATIVFFRVVARRECVVRGLDGARGVELDVGGIAQRGHAPLGVGAVVEQLWIVLGCLCACRTTDGRVVWPPHIVVTLRPCSCNRQQGQQNG